MTPWLEWRRRDLRVQTVGMALAVTDRRMVARMDAAAARAARSPLGAIDEMIEREMTRTIERSLDRYLARWARRRGVLLVEGAIKWGIRRVDLTFADPRWELLAYLRGIEPPFPDWVDAMARAGDRLVVDPKAATVSVAEVDR